MNFEEEYKSLKEENLLLTVTVEKLKEEIIQGKKEIEELREHLKKYTAPTRSKKYYENHKEEIKEKQKEYRTTIESSKKAEYNKKYYLKKNNIKKTKLKN